MGKAKLNIPMCAALVLLLLTMISIHMTSGLYARYTTTASGGDGARVAKFDVAFSVAPLLDGDGKPVEGKYTLTVTNRSEVAVRYSLTVTIPNSLSVAVDDGEAASPEDAENAVTFENDGWTLAPGENTGSHTLTFAVVNWSGLTKDSGSSEQVGLDFNVTVTAEQID